MAEAENKVEAKAATKAKEPTYTKAQVCKSKLYAGYYDVFDIVLEDGKQYTKAELEQLKTDFLNRPVEEEIND